MMKRMDGRRVRFEGDLGQWAKYELLSRATALLWTPVAFEEPFGLGIIEAMACGTPVLGRPVGDVPELIPSWNLFHNFPSVHQVAGLKSKPPKNWREIAERFSVERMTDAYLALYRQAAELGSGGRDVDAARDGAGSSETILELPQRLTSHETV